jgi:Ca2+-binding EF-hand superfamily protein
MVSGSTSFSLSVSEGEIQSVYERFMELDTDGDGFLSTDDFLSISGLESNPLLMRVISVFDEEFSFFFSPSLLLSFSPSLLLLFFIFGLIVLVRRNSSNPIATLSLSHSLTLTHILEEKMPLDSINSSQFSPSFTHPLSLTQNSNVSLSLSLSLSLLLSLSLRLFFFSKYLLVFSLRTNLSTCVVVFKIFDLNGDGKIEEEELYEVMKLLVGPSLTEQQLHVLCKRTMEDCDHDQDGSINKDEFIKVHRFLFSFILSLSLSLSLFCFVCFVCFVCFLNFPDFLAFVFLFVEVLFVGDGAHRHNQVVHDVLGGKDEGKGKEERDLVGGRRRNHVE